MYEALSQFAQTGGLLMFVAIFVAVLVYALWPKNQAKFDAAANMALHDDAPVNDENEDKSNV